MDVATLLHLFIMAVTLAVKIAAPILLAAVVIGLAVSLFQALTQINESTLAFIPKLLVVAVVIYLTLPWMVQEMVGFTTYVFSFASQVVQ